MNRWYNVHDELPAIDAECIVLNKEGRISFAHMVDKNVAVDYDGWNIPNVVWWTHFDPSEELEEYYGQVGEAKQADAALAESRLSHLRQTDRANFERIILENIQFLDQGDVVEYLSTATLNNELLYRERKERLDKPNDK
jgi:hypothetical protein